METYLLSLLAGGLTTLSPCVLPVLPLITGSALQEHRLGPIAVALGMTVSFVIVGVSLAALGTVFGLDQDLIRELAGWLLLAVGIILISKRLQDLVAKLMGPLASSAERFLQAHSFTGLFGQLLVGLLLGAVWSPCSGPTLGAAVALAAESGGQFEAASIMTAFGLGASLPLLVIAYGLRGVFSKKRDQIGTVVKHAKLIFGVLLGLVGILILTGADKALESLALELLPNWFSDLSIFF